MDSTIIAAIIAALTSFALVGYRVWQKRPKSLKVKRITRRDDPDLRRALDIYHRIPEYERNDDEDMVRWVQETADGINSDLQEYLLVCKWGALVCGMMFFQYYRSARYIFISYLVSGKEVVEARQGRATQALLGHVEKLVRKELRGCRGIVAEVDRPLKKDRALARIKTFRREAVIHGYHLRALDIDYRQPLLDLWEEDQTEEKPLLLLYARTTEHQLEGDAPREEVEDILRFIADQVYGDSFETDPGKDSAYRRYLKQWYADRTRGLPPSVRAWKPA